MAFPIKISLIYIFSKSQVLGDGSIIQNFVENPKVFILQYAIHFHAGVLLNQFNYVCRIIVSKVYE
jgi:hypothetical protein